MKKLVIVFFVLVLMVLLQNSLAAAYDCPQQLKAVVCTTSYSEVSTIGERPNRIEISNEQSSRPYVLFVDSKKADIGFCGGSIDEYSVEVANIKCESKKYQIEISNQDGAFFYDKASGKVFSYRNCVNLACVNRVDFK